MTNTSEILPEARRPARSVGRPRRPIPKSLQPAKLLPLLEEPHRVLFLDIETTGLSRYYDEITLVGYAIDGVYRVHVAGDDPTGLRKALSQAVAIVTFNGTLFDVPFLQKTFDEIPVPQNHVDLRYTTKSIGLTGGQKSIEHQLGITIRDGLEDVDGRVAVLLWHEYLRGDQGALKKLIEYNLADVRGLCHILDHVYSQWERPADLFLKTPSFSELMRGVEGYAKPRARLPSPKRLGRRFTTFDELFKETPAARATIVGVDLTGSEKRPSGFCVLSGHQAKTQMLATDSEIIHEILQTSPSLVSIDSPLSLPAGRVRVTDDDPGRDQFGIMRLCERELKRRGINVYPCLLPSMQRLTERGMRLAKTLRELGVPVIESYPGAAQDIMGIPRKGAGEALLRLGLANFGITGEFVTEPVKHDELDAITSAIVGSFFLAGKYEALTGPNEHALIVPDLKAASGPLVVGISGAMGAGKTTSSRYLERNGFAYSRFSQVIDELIGKEGLTPDRDTRQKVGWQVNQKFGQRWLCEQVVERVQGAQKIVIDGLRFPEDHAYFVERYSSRFVHIHVHAADELRRARLVAQGVSVDEFQQASSQPTEAQVPALAKLATCTIPNDGSIASLEEFIEACIRHPSADSPAGSVE